jgi:hypothetical protein
MREKLKDNFTLLLAIGIVVIVVSPVVDLPPSVTNNTLMALAMLASMMVVAGIAGRIQCHGWPGNCDRGRDCSGLSTGHGCARVFVLLC